MENAMGTLVWREGLNLKIVQGIRLGPWSKIPQNLKTKYLVHGLFRTFYLVNDGKKLEQITKERWHGLTNYKLSSPYPL